MFDGEIVKKNFGLRKFSPKKSKKRSKKKLDLENFFFFVQKALKCHVSCRNCEKKFPFEKNFGLGKFSPKKSKKRSKKESSL